MIIVLAKEIVTLIYYCTAIFPLYCEWVRYHVLWKKCRFLQNCEIFFVQEYCWWKSIWRGNGWKNILLKVNAIQVILSKKSKVKKHTKLVISPNDSQKSGPFKNKHYSSWYNRHVWFWKCVSSTWRREVPKVWTFPHTDFHWTV